MAKSRMLSRKIAIDKELNELSLKSQLIYTWCIPFLDDYGLLTNNEGDIKYLIFPRNSNIEERDIEIFKAEASPKLIEILDDCIHFNGFENHNQLTEYKKSFSQFNENRFNKGKSRCSPEIPRNPQNNSPKVKESKGKESKDNNLTPLTPLYPFLDNKYFVEKLDDFREMRKKIRAPATEKAIELILKELHKYKLEEAMEMLDQSITRSWRGVFPIKNENKGGVLKLR